MLKLLDQEENFKSLNWFTSVKMRMSHQAEKIEKERANAKVSKNEPTLKDTQDMDRELSSRKMNNFKTEIQWLEYCLVAAQVFFR